MCAKLVQKKLAINKPNLGIKDQLSYLNMPYTKWLIARVNKGTIHNIKDWVVLLSDLQPLLCLSFLFDQIKIYFVKLVQICKCTKNFNTEYLKYQILLEFITIHGRLPTILLSQHDKISGRLLGGMVVLNCVGRW